MKKIIINLLFLFLLLVGCERPDPGASNSGEELIPPSPIVIARDKDGNIISLPTPTLFAIEPTKTAVVIPTPTLDPPHYLLDSSIQLWTVHEVSYGESLGYLAEFYETSVDELLEKNGLLETDFLYVGQKLQVPGSSEAVSDPFKMIPDSELVYGVGAKEFDLIAFANQHGGYLTLYEENVEGRLLNGPEIVQLIAQRFSVNPRLLLAVLEYRTGWVTQRTGIDDGYPLGYRKPGYEGLYQQLAWAANGLNWGYYARAEGGATSTMLADGIRVAFHPQINHGTAAVQNWLGEHTGATYAEWLQAIGPNGFYVTYRQLFGDPFAYDRGKVVLDELVQPQWGLPWAEEEVWYFTGGPHGGWGGGSAWAAMDFVPVDEMLGCYDSDAWVVAIGDGIVVRSDFGGVVIDSDGDGYAGTGWAVIYMHLANDERIGAGTVVKRGDPIGHPSCEGGYSNGTHLHIARTFNGRWIAADGALPFTMAGWEPQGLGREYDGLMVRDDEVREACECRDVVNEIDH